jgi:hypothetical protein
MAMVVVVEADAADEKQQVAAAVTRGMGRLARNGDWSVRCRKHQSLWPLWFVSIQNADQPFARSFVGPQDLLAELIRGTMMRAGFLSGPAMGARSSAEVSPAER